MEASRWFYYLSESDEAWYEEKFGNDNSDESYDPDLSDDDSQLNQDLSPMNNLSLLTGFVDSIWSEGVVLILLFVTSLLEGRGCILVTLVCTNSLFHERVYHLYYFQECECALGN
jgi:hypothetical protein